MSALVIVSWLLAIEPARRKPTIENIFIFIRVLHYKVIAITIKINNKPVTGFRAGFKLLYCNVSEGLLYYQY